MDFILRGIPASRGLAHGRIAVVREWTTSLTVERGAVLATPWPQAALSPLLNTAAALLCAHGGVLASLITLAREYGIPVVVGLGEELDHLRDGTTVWVDGHHGWVCSFDPRGIWRASVEQLARTPTTNDAWSFLAARKEAAAP
jgi:pyruvate,water dikinase